MSEWKDYYLGDVVDYKKGFAFKSNWYQRQGRYIVRVSDTTLNSINIASCNCISEELASQFEDYSLMKDDVIIATVGSWPNNPSSVVGKVVKVPDEANNALLNQNAVRLRGNEKIDNKFLYYLLKSNSFSKYIVSKAQGSANQASITLKDIFGFSFKAPELEEQSLIANYLYAIDSKIAVNRRICENLEAQAQVLFKHWFIDFAPFLDKPSGKAERKNGNFVESELGMIPEGWRVVTLGEICKCELGGTPSRANKSYWGGNIAWINSGEVNKFRICEASEYITEDGLNHSATKLLPAKTTVLAITGATLGQVSLLEIDSCANQSVVGVKENSKAPYAFIYPAIKSKIQELVNMQTGGAQQHINKDNIQSLRITIPPQNIMEEYKSAAIPMYNEIGNLCFENLRLSTLRDTLLPKLMSGQIKV